MLRRCRKKSKAGRPVPDRPGKDDTLLVSVGKRFLYIMDEPKQEPFNGTGRDMTRQCGFIFDMDGTIVDNMGYHVQAWLELFKELGIPMTAEEFNRRLTGRTNGQILKIVLGDDRSEQEIRELADRKEERYREIYRPHRAPVAGLTDFLEAAATADFPMAVATSAPEVNIKYILDGLNIRGYFRAVVGAEDVRNGKPHPEMFLTTADRLQVAPAGCLVFEDSLAGVEAADRAGMQVGALTTTHEKEEFEGSPAVLFTTSDFTEITPAGLAERLRHHRNEILE